MTKSKVKNWAIYGVSTLVVVAVTFFFFAPLIIPFSLGLIGGSFITYKVACR